MKKLVGVLLVLAVGSFSEDLSDWMPLQVKFRRAYAPIPVIGELLVDPEMRELYWDEKHGFIRDPKAPDLILQYKDTVRIAQSLFFVPAVENDAEVPEISYMLHQTVGLYQEGIYSGEPGIGSDCLEKLFNLSPDPPASFKSEKRYFYHRNLSAGVSYVFYWITWPPKKLLHVLFSPSIEVYDHLTLVTTETRYEKCRLFIYPSSFYLFCRGLGLVAFGHNTAGERNYYMLDQTGGRMQGEEKKNQVEPSKPRPSWRRKR